MLVIEVQSGMDATTLAESKTAVTTGNI